MNSKETQPGDDSGHVCAGDTGGAGTGGKPAAEPLSRQEEVALPSQNHGNEETKEAPTPPEGPKGPINEPPNASPTKNEGGKDSKNFNGGADLALVQWTKAIAAFTFCLFIAAILQFWAMRGQQSVMQGQLNEMHAEQRPWIYADIQIGGSFFWNQSGGLSVPIAFNLHNTGHLPAFYVSPKIQIYLSGEDGRLGEAMVSEKQIQICSQDARIEQNGMTVFPTQSVGSISVVGITKAEITNVKASNEKRGFAASGLDPWIVGCIQYQMPDGSVGRTGVAIILVMTKPGVSGTYELPADPTHINPTNLIAEPWVQGEYAN